MKKSLFAVMMLPAVALTSVTSHASTASLKCISYDVVDGWTGEDTHARVVLTAKVASNDELQDAAISGAYISDVRDLRADEGYKPRSPRYFGMNRFSLLEDAWCNFTPILPKKLSAQSKGKKFTGYVQVSCESGNQPTIGLFCSIE